MNRINSVTGPLTRLLKHEQELAKVAPSLRPKSSCFWFEGGGGGGGLGERWQNVSWLENALALYHGLE